MLLYYKTKVAIYFNTSNNLTLKRAILVYLLLLQAVSRNLNKLSHVCIFYSHRTNKANNKPLHNTKPLQSQCANAAAHFTKLGVIYSLMH